ncbi:hypothetical protein [Roseibium sp. Sym1]|uniref:hypothetical protein n=1 Tax=Roseibium sp. Sym1 TaxID=3016006 RepID=UPI0022B49743|nr:hypothetical protein [Roseibium sp. Sym1]
MFNFAALLGLITLFSFLAEAGGKLLPKSDTSRFFNYISSLLRPTGSTARALDIFNALFGHRFFGLRAIIFSIFLTTVFVTLASITAIATSRNLFSDYFDQLSSVGPLGFICIAIALLGTYVADFVSYTKTRILLGAMNTYKNFGVTVILLLSDLFSTILIFSLIFAVARTIIYVALMSTMAQPVGGAFLMAPNIMSGAARELGIAVPEVVSGDNETSRRLRLLREINNYSQNEDDASKELASAYFNEKNLYKKWDFFEISYKNICLEELEPQDVKKFLQNDYFSYGAKFFIDYYDDLSKEVEASKFIEKKNELESGDVRSILAALHNSIHKRVTSGPPDCTIRLLALFESYDLTKMRKWLTPLDIYASAFATTFGGVTDSAINKFGLFIITDALAELPRVLSNAWVFHAVNFLGTHPADRASLSVASSLAQGSWYVGTASVPLPFTSFAASSLGATFILWILLSAEALGVVAYRLRDFAYLCFKSERVQNFPLTFLALSVVLVLGVFLIMQFIVAQSWQMFL